MKKKTLSFLFIAGLGTLALSSYKSSPATSGAGNRTGAGGSSANCSSGGCHAASSSSTLASFMIAEAATPSTPVSKYKPGTLYTITLGGTNTSAKPKFGFQAAITDAGGTTIGTLTATAANTAVHTSGTMRIVEHTTPLTGSSGVYTVKFNWTAPAAGSGTASIYGILNAVDGDNSTANDAPSNGFKLDVPEDVTSSIAENELNGKFQIVPNPATDHFSIKNLENNNASVAIYSMNGTQVMLTTAGKDINVSGLATGSYIVHINNNGQLSAAIMVKQ